MATIFRIEPRPAILPLTMLCIGCLGMPAQAHFVWLVPAEDGKAVEVYFSEDATANDADLLEYVEESQLWRVVGKDTHVLKTQRDDDSLSAALPESDRPAIDRPAIVVLRHEFGVMQRGGETFLLRYYAKTGPQAVSSVWEDADCRKVVDLDIMPTAAEKQIQLKVSFQGKPASGAQVVVIGPGMKDHEATTDEQGLVSFSPAKAGLYSIRARHTEERAGIHDEKTFDSIRHYATLALPIENVTTESPALAANDSSDRPYPDLPAALTSFGAAVLGDRVYAYGGHTGEAHSYSNSAQSDELIQLSLTEPAKWQTIARGPRLQGLALVATGDKLYRIGGFTAKNEDGDEHDLWSQADVASYDPASKSWNELPPLPEPRSSFDAAVVNGVIYVAGGWQLHGEEDPHWHTTAWRFDPAAEKPQWEAISDPPFQRRALALAAHDRKLFALGGMQEKGGPTTRVDLFDTRTSKWTRGPDLPGEPMEGFGCSAFAVGGRLYASTISGNLLRLSEDEASWEKVQELETARFFHRMLPIGEKSLLMLGGADMEVGKFDHVDVVETE